MTTETILIIGASGNNGLATIESLTLDQLHAVLAPKVDAALHLHELTAHKKLSMFVMYASTH